MLEELHTTRTGNANERRILLVTSIGHLLCHLSELAFIGLIPTLVHEFGLTVDLVTLLAVPGFVLYGFGGLAAGVFTDRRGPVAALHVYFAAVMVMCCVIYFSDNAWQLRLGLTGLGAAISIYHPAGLSMLSLGCTNRGLAMGINGVAGNLGVAAGPALGLLVLAWGLPWRATYLVIAAIALAGVVTSLLVPIQMPEHEPSARRGGNGTRHAAWPLLIVLLATMLVGGFNYRSLTTVLPSYLSGTADLATQSAGGSAVTSVQSGIVFLVFALGGFGQILGGYLADKFRPALLYIIAILITAPLALCLAHLQLGAGIWIAGVMAVFLFAEQPLENSMVAEATPVRYRSTMYGLKFVFAFGIASLGAYVAGLVWRVEGVQRVFEMYAGLSMLMGALASVYFFLARRASVI